eukprot:TRINITY_DN2447_c0_g1_i1.p1 TRINITY_DN2447_c0_g1~~TRINITY_DN2447_c0_g1_i1.p1  ORF type:complete len:397 (-),score=100.18 TRINITY_DN2447_c0_g1_i1:372-1562(-)
MVRLTLALLWGGFVVKLVTATPSPPPSTPSTPPECHDKSKCREDGKYDDDCRAGLTSSSCADGYIKTQTPTCDAHGSCDYYCCPPTTPSTTPSVQMQCRSKGDAACEKNPSACPEGAKVEYKCEMTCKLHGHQDVRCNVNSVAIELGAHQATGSKILLIGDSMAEYSGAGDMAPQSSSTLQVACKGSTVNNRGAGGTTTRQWLANDGKWVTEAIATGTGWTHVWVTLGGNDLPVDLNCGRDGGAKDAFKSDLSKVISMVKKSTSAQIVLTGYAVTAADDTCTLEQLRQNILEGQKELAAADPRVTFASVETAAGGIMDPAARTAAKCYNGVLTSEVADPQLQKMVGVPPCRGDKSLFVADLFHLNPKGYAKAWALPAVQNAFGCQSSGSAANSTMR